MTWIVAPIFVSDVDATLAQMLTARREGADALELRCDRATPETMETLLGRPEIHRTRLIVTIRPVWEGGDYRGGEQDRLQLLALACRRLTSADFLDVELAAWNQSDKFRSVLTDKITPFESPAGNGPRLIISTHDFSGAPPNMENHFAALAAVRAASLLKIAFRARNVHDAFAALRLYDHARRLDPRPLVSIAMDEAGRISRLLAAKFEAAFTFATPADQTGTAPAQPRIDDLKNVYRFDRQRADWSVFALAGWPVSHSISPAIHNAGFRELGFPGVYVPLPIEPGWETFVAAVDAARNFRELRLAGLSVTIPHKQNAFRYVSERGGTLDETARRIRAINTIFFHPDGSIGGINSDWMGARDALTVALGIAPECLGGYEVAVIGAGGAARAIVAGLASYGAVVVIYNRTLEHGRELAREFGGATGRVRAAPLEEFPHTTCRVLINCTPLGMTPNIQALPIPDTLPLHRDMVVFDTVYNPRQTRLLKLAREQGAHVVEGMEMLWRQAAVQFEGFTLRPAPLDAMRRAALAALAE
jgi:3-dehydroquinate dehydratase/shikimate dehydrogenase